jgi:hypothetical protein
MRPEADDRDERQQRECHQCARRDARPLPPCPGGKHHEWQREPSGGLHANPDDKQGGCRAEVVSPCLGRCLGGVRGACVRALPHRRIRRTGCPPRARGGGSGFASRERQRIVVRPAHGQLQEHGIQANEHRRLLG